MRSLARIARLRVDRSSLASVERVCVRGIRRHFSAVHVAGKRFPFPRFELLNMLLSFKTDVTSKDADRVREAVPCFLIKLSQVCKYGSKLKKFTKLDNGTGVRV